MSSTPSAPRRDYRIHQQLGAALALALLLLAFTLPAPPETPDDVLPPEDTPAVLIQIPQSVVTPPAPPPPPKLPPPVEVDDQQIVDEVVETMPPLPDGWTPSPPRAPTPPAPPPVPVPTPDPPPLTPETYTDGVLPFVPVEDQPVLIGGLDGLQSRLSYPEVAQRIGASGTVYVQFVVDEEGRVSSTEILRSPHPALSEAALDALLNSEFEPGRQRGKAVKVRLTLPVRFVLR